jgi:hypothetical protein
MESTEEDVPAEPMSMGARVLNVFAAPGELFSWLAQHRFRIANFVVPALIVGAVGVITTWLVLSQPEIIRQVLELNDRELEKAISQGRLTMEQADHARDGMRSAVGIMVMRAAAAVFSVISGFVAPFWWGLLGWLVARFVLGAPLGYMRAVEAAAFASLIGALGLVVGMLLSLGTGNLFAGPHLGFFIEDFNPMNKRHLALASVNAFGLWQVAVLALGIARLTGRTFTQAGVGLYVLWLAYKGLAAAFGLAAFAT